MKAFPRPHCQPNRPCLWVTGASAPQPSVTDLESSRRQEQDNTHALKDRNYRCPQRVTVSNKEPQLDPRHRSRCPCRRPTSSTGMRHEPVSSPSLDLWAVTWTVPSSPARRGRSVVTFCILPVASTKSPPPWLISLFPFAFNRDSQTPLW